MTHTAQPETRQRIVYPPFCREFGWLISRGGWIRLLELKITLRQPPAEKLRGLFAACGVTVRRCNWHGEELACLKYREGRCIVAAANAREPP